jgi:hypothetical protein
MIVRCTNCGAETSETSWNCPACRINLYWSSEHYDDLASIRTRHGLGPHAETPEFLRRAHAGAMSERRDAGAENKVRQVARRAMEARRRGRMPSPEGMHLESRSGSDVE